MSHKLGGTSAQNWEGGVAPDFDFRFGRDGSHCSCDPVSDDKVILLYLALLTEQLALETGSRQFSYTVTLGKFQTRSVSNFSTEVRLQSSAVRLEFTSATPTRLAIRLELVASASPV